MHKKSCRCQRSAIVVGACSRRTLLPEHTVSAPGTRSVIDASSAPAASSDARDAGAEASPSTRSPKSAVVDFSLPQGCDQLFDQHDACEALQSLLGAHARLENRACLRRVHGVVPGYRASCEWGSFSSRPRSGTYDECYSDRFSGEGVACTIMNYTHEDEAPSATYDATEKFVRRCLLGWSYEQAAKSRVFVDRAFRLSKVVDEAEGKVATHVQACAFTEPPHSIDETPQPHVRLEIFVEGKPPAVSPSPEGAAAR
jgi:hypothetical protein